MKIKITGVGVSDSNGLLLSIGTEVELSAVPKGWEGLYEVTQADPEPEAVAVTNPKRAPKE